MCRRIILQTPLLSWVYCHSGRNISGTHNKQKPQLYFLNRLDWRFEVGDLTELQSVFLLFRTLWHLEVQRYHMRTNILSPRNTVTHTRSWPSHLPCILCHAQSKIGFILETFLSFVSWFLCYFFHGLFLSLLGYFFIIHLLWWLLLTVNFVRPKITWPTSHWACLWGSF